MTIFNEETTLVALNEMKTREEYARRRFKKKYNFEPDKPGSNTGTITNGGKKYKVDIGKSDYIYKDSDQKLERDTMSDLSSKDSTIYLGSNKYFKLKGSNKGERRDSVMQHELGHQNLHNINYENRTTDKNKRTEEVYNAVNKATGQNKDPVHKNLYLGYSTATDLDKEKRNMALKRATELSKSKQIHSVSPIEFEADRYSANKTSKGAIKRALRNAQMNDKRDNSRKGGKVDHKENVKRFNNRSLRSKALDDKTLRDSDIYK